MVGAGKSLIFAVWRYSVHSLTIILAGSGSTTNNHFYYS